MEASQPFLLFQPVLALNLRQVYVLLWVKLSVDAQEATDALVFACSTRIPRHTRERTVFGTLRTDCGLAGSNNLSEDLVTVFEGGYPKLGSWAIPIDVVRITSLP
jgi:hypothetical protein